MAADGYQPTIVVVPGSSLPAQTWWPQLHSIIITSFQQKDIQAFPPTWTRLDPDASNGAQKLAQELGPQGFIAVVFGMFPSASEGFDDPTGALNGSGKLKRLQPIACGGFLPFRGENWVSKVESSPGNPAAAVKVPNGQVTADETTEVRASTSTPSPSPAEVMDWELCCFCVHPSWRKLGLSHKLLEEIQAFILPRGAKRLIANYSLEETGKYWPNMGFETLPGVTGVLKKGFTHTAGMEGFRADIHFQIGAKALG